MKIDLNTNPMMKNYLMSKLGLLKDSDFKCLHDRKLPVTIEDMATVEDFLRTIELDVRFLESLRIMDYSLFLIVLEMPSSREKRESESIQMSCRDLDSRLNSPKKDSCFNQRPSNLTGDSEINDNFED